MLNLNPPWFIHDYTTPITHVPLYRLFIYIFPFKYIFKTCFISSKIAISQSSSFALPNLSILMYPEKVSPALSRGLGVRQHHWIYILSQLMSWLDLLPTNFQLDIISSWLINTNSLCPEPVYYPNRYTPIQLPVVHDIIHLCSSCWNYIQIYLPAKLSCALIFLM